MLTDEDYRVVLAKDGFEALKIYEIWATRSDSSFSIFSFPIMDGDAVFDELRSAEPEHQRGFEQRLCRARQDQLDAGRGSARLYSEALHAAKSCSSKSAPPSTRAVRPPCCSTPQAGRVAGNSPRAGTDLALPRWELHGADRLIFQTDGRAESLRPAPFHEQPADAANQWRTRARGFSRRCKNDELKAMVYEIAPEGKIKIFEETSDVDFGYEVPGVARYRAISSSRNTASPLSSA